ncbi:solute carrier family 23 protein [Demequina sp. SYSU T00039]|uniref:Solute carrier family 23 protein n=1 Tax=Demequina lignilytica TaxID=3051663 RepID=A0AAW7M8T8_9MICO|nr:MULTISPECIES: solute carrier family 23 protein [unclassified Demequina]MDN4478695.1 solute carrier family 23 protein [Demequina sp. SYSU T00039-1]MDN4488673.1 solute carrier family 23 protein [Demequina sp. SYSU T00039]MDN4491871.1 solute carrier family 23 protein [Demequina sp. SYSU T00068]
MALMSWTLHGDGRSVSPGATVAPRERLSWPRTIGIGAQHVLAMFGATFLVPVLTGFPPSTTLFFSAIGTVLFLLVTGNRLPSYLGSSFAFIAPIGVAMASGGMGVAMGGIVMTGVLLAVVGVVVHLAGTRWIEVTMPPVVTGSIVMLIGLNLAGTAKAMFGSSPVTALVSALSVLVITVAFRGILGRLSILLGAVVGGIVAAIRGEYDLSAVKDAAWFGLPELHTPRFDLTVLAVFVPVVLVLVAENIGHVKSVAAMTGDNLDPVTGRALLADGLATTVAGLGGGSGTTTYAENIGVMAATRVYSTAAYWVAAAFAMLLSLSPKFGALIAATPGGVLGGLALVLFGMIAVLGARIWVQGNVDFGNPVTLMPAGIALIVGAANFVWVAGDMTFEGIALGTAAALVTYHLMALVARWRGAAR